MDLSAITNATTASTTASSESAAQTTVTQDQFLELLVTQLRNQDPLNPQDSTEFTAQLAQFSSLEQLVNLNDGMESLIQYQNSIQNAYVTNLIGKTVGFAGTDSSGAPATTYGSVTGVSFEDGLTYLVVDGATKIQLGDITEIL